MKKKFFFVILVYLSLNSISQTKVAVYLDPYALIDSVTTICDFATYWGM